MSTSRWHGLAVVLVVALLMGTRAAHAADPWLGTWKVASAAVAPWADKTRPLSEAEKKALVGKAVTFKAGEIAGPRAFACKGPKYKVSDFSADMLFQGAFGEMHEKDKSVDPAKVAASVGFQGGSWKVLETGCANEVDWHFIDATTLAVGLNDYVYVLKKQ
jgi:hypothetical protein